MRLERVDALVLQRGRVDDAPQRGGVRRVPIGLCARPPVGPLVAHWLCPLVAHWLTLQTWSGVMAHRIAANMSLRAGGKASGLSPHTMSPAACVSLSDIMRARALRGIHIRVF